ncbi:MAG: hypothetical protein WD802_04480 [Gemmatimonadaceae bacterium]
MVQAIDGRMDNISEAIKSTDVHCPYEPEEGGTYIFRFTKQARSISPFDGSLTRCRLTVSDAKSMAYPRLYHPPLGSTVRMACGVRHEYRAGPGVYLELLGVQTSAILPPRTRRRRPLVTPPI